MCVFHKNCGRILYTLNSHLLTLKAPITASHLLTLSAENIFEASMTNSVDPDKTATASILILGPHCIYTYVNQ